MSLAAAPAADTVALPPAVWRRARPLLGTLVEVGVVGAAAHDEAWAMRAGARAFAAVQRVQDCLSRFAPGSDVSRLDRKSTRLNSSHSQQSRMPSSA